MDTFVCPLDCLVPISICTSVCLHVSIVESELNMCVCICIWVNVRTLYNVYVEWKRGAFSMISSVKFGIDINVEYFISYSTIYAYAKFDEAIFFFEKLNILSSTIARCYLSL